MPLPTCSGTIVGGGQILIEFFPTESNSRPFSDALHNTADLSEMAGVGEAVARKAIQAARNMMKLGFVSGDSSGNYELGIPSSFGCTRNTVKHELVHVANKDYMHGALHYLFIGEPRAILYGTFGIKI